ncbi:hypothetical protein HMPREF3193_01312 [Bifidobacterium breve]|nr:hypothetical protein HMPREF3193_01312 [Bifidobacterium breve]
MEGFRAGELERMAAWLNENMVMEDLPMHRKDKLCKGYPGWASLIHLSEGSQGAIRAGARLDG